MAEAVRESNFKDYGNVLNPAFIPYYNPELRFNSKEDKVGDLGFDTPEFQEAYNMSNIHTKKAMLDANTASDAIKIKARRDIFDDSSKAIEQDGMMTQLGMGIVPSLMSPTTLLPFGGVFKAAQVAKAASRLTKVAQVGGAGAVTGAVANVADEALFDAQGMPTNYLGAAGIGAAFGGFLGGLSGALSGPSQKVVANALLPENDSFSKDFSIDPDIRIDLNEDGTIKLQDIGQMEKSIVDGIPLLGRLLRSDVHTVFQAESPLLRSYMGRISSATTSLKDSMGNLLPIKKTGMDFKRQLKGVHNVLNNDVTQSYELYRQKGYTGSRSEFNTEVYKVYVEEMNRQKKSAAEYANQKTAHMELDEVPEGEVSKFKKAYMEAENEWYDANPHSFKGDEALVKGAEGYKKYFDTILKSGQDMNLKGLKGISKNRLYAPRIYNYKAIKAGKISMDDVKVQIRNGLEGDPRNSFTSPKDLEASTEAIYNQLLKTSFNLESLTNSFLVKDLPFETHLKQRKLYLDESKMLGLLDTDFEDVAGRYHYKMSGRQATHYAFGTDELSDIMDNISKEHVARGILDNPEEIAAFRRSVEDLLGTLRMNSLSNTPSWTFTRNLMTYNSTRMGGGFGGNQFIELAASFMLNGFSAIMNGGIKRSLKTSAKLLYTKDPDITEFSKYLIASGHMQDVLHTSRINRFADTEAGFNSGTLENTLHWMNDKLMKYNGMRYFMGVMEDFTGGAIVTQLKSGNIDVERLTRWGLNRKDADSLGKALKKATKNDQWDLTQLTELQRDQLQLAIGRGIEEVVVQGDSIHLPAWMKVPSAAKSVIFQFMRFPLIAQETLTRRGFKEDQARLFGSILASSATYVGMKYLREQASIATGATHPIDAKYDYTEDDEVLQRALLESLNYNAGLGFASSIYNYAAVATGSPELGREWQGKYGMPSLLGPSYGGGEDLIQLMRAGVEGELDTERNLQRFKSLTPFMNLPLINEGSKAFIEEFGR